METLDTNNGGMIIIQVLRLLFFCIPTLLFIGIAIYYLNKMKSKTEGILILIGNIIILLSIIVNTLLFVMFMDETWEHMTYSYILSGINILSFIGSMLFVAGTFLLIKRVIKTKSLTGTIINNVTEDTTS
ncbi:hypothetical protein [uncultured Aquimarina sp.]|uniref:hypothetical protein n=1 Tax=uncultured Aquimarina sp. TaxID=575652 RepID=UPI002615E435|nr:hypothetical protein [uncultured Aquimarina sp.]